MSNTTDHNENNPPLIPAPGSSQLCCDDLLEEAMQELESAMRTHVDCAKRCKAMLDRLKLVGGNKEFSDARAQKTTKLDKPPMGAMRPKR